MNAMVNARNDTGLRIDGSYGEGGGQILRTSLALSCVLGRAIELDNIRKARKKPGLQPQHLTAVKAAAAISNARVEGAELSSTSLRFSPGRIIGDNYSFDVAEKKGSAGSTSLVLQTIMLPLCFAEQPSTITISGGTHAPWSPSFHYLRHVFLNALSRAGASVDLSLEKWGWYPIGGGKIIARIDPIRAFSSHAIIGRGKLKGVSGISAVSNLPQDIAIRQRSRALIALRQRGVDAAIEIVSAPSPGKGTFVFLLAEFDNITAGFDALGALGKRAEAVADEACRALFEYLDATGALDPHLADQIIPYCALSESASEFTTSRVTRHLLTNIWVVQQFTSAVISVEGKEGEEGRISVRPVRESKS
jgi:RNA 3'-terminal phosphate cyclase (ATP)